jgi:GAF domain-containing protein
MLILFAESPCGPPLSGVDFVERAMATVFDKSAREHAAQRARVSKELLRDRRPQILAETARNLIAGKDPDREVLPALYRTLAAERIVDASLGFIVTDQETTTMKLGFIKGFPKEVVQRCLTLDFGQAICGTVAKNRRSIHATDIQRTLDPLADLVRSAGMTAYACEPLVVADKFYGTLSFASRTRRAFDAEDLLFFREIARQVAIARSRVLPGQP